MVAIFEMQPSRSDVARETLLNHRGTEAQSKIWVLFIMLLYFLSVVVTPPVEAQDFLSDGEEPSASAQEESSNDPEQLIREAELLIARKQPIDARAKLQKALQLSPEDHRIHLMLGHYYLTEVGHFKLAYRYIRTAEDLFLKRYSRLGGDLGPEQLRDSIFLLYLRSEAELNLDQYQDSLNTLDRLAKLFPPAELGWYMATRAWVLMKLKRLDEAVQTAQQGLLVDSDSKRIYNILGILLSLKGNRDLSLKAFARSAAGEMSYGSLGQAATPLNNAGEVYREMFRDSLAEASWLRALQMPDGCDHILPSLNMSILYNDQTRFLQAERVLKDFEACYATQSEKQDTEHRALLSLSRGRIALHNGEFDRAIDFLREAEEREQWFGKIGTNENDVRLAATIAMANVLAAKRSILKDTVRDHWVNRLEDYAQIPQLKLRSWWLQRQARRMAVEELGDLEDLSIRNSDTMIEYPTLGRTLAGFPTLSLKRRIERLTKTDIRAGAHLHYHLYLAQNLIAHGKSGEALPILMQLRDNLRPIDRLARAEVLTLIVKAQADARPFWRSASAGERQASLKIIQELFGLLPSEIRSADLALPVTASFFSPNGEQSPAAKKVRSLLKVRLPDAEPELREACEYELRVRESPGDSAKGAGSRNITLELVQKAGGSFLASESGTISADGLGYEDLLSRFLNSAFHHRRDPPGEPVPALELLDDIMPDN